MIVSHAEVRTESASRYLVQLSKHWSHRFPDLTYDTARADIPLPGGRTVLEAGGGLLKLAITTETEAEATRLEQVVTDHLKRFAFREQLEFNWTRAEEGA